MTKNTFYQKIIAFERVLAEMKCVLTLKNTFFESTFSMTRTLSKSTRLNLLTHNALQYLINPSYQERAKTYNEKRIRQLSERDFFRTVKTGSWLNEVHTMTCIEIYVIAKRYQQKNVCFNMITITFGVVYEKA